jgi:hypothetical protein
MTGTTAAVSVAGRIAMIQAETELPAFGLAAR